MRKKKNKGQALLETVMVLPLLLLFFCAIIDFGRILHASVSLNSVAQETVRLAGLGKLDSEVSQFAYNNTALNNKDALKVNISPTYANRRPGDYVTVKIDYEVKYITPLINLILPSPFIVHTQSTTRVE